MALTANEQYLLELINRARLDPLAEAARLGTDLNTGLAAGTISGKPVQVLAPNENLNDASQTHGEWMIAADVFSHTGMGGSSPGDRMTAAGYVFAGSWSWRENLSWVGTTGTLNAAASIYQQYVNLYNSAGHRVNTFGAEVREIGLAQVIGKFQSGSYNFNASMVVENFALSGKTIFVTGVVYQDSDMDGFYSIGEGRSGLTFKIGTANDMSETAGGYSVGVAAASSVTVSIAEGGVSIGSVLMDTTGGNVKLDMLREGTDWVALVSSTTVLKSGIADARLLGVANATLRGNALDNHLVGNAGANTLKGEAGNDTLDGGLGVDTLIGGAGDDTYIVDSALDYISGETATGGTDTVLSSVSYKLRPYVENLTLTGTAGINAAGNDHANHLIGNSGSNVLNGGAGNDTLDGGAGADTMKGGLGSDTFVVDHAGDAVIEVADATGIDTVRSSVNFTLGTNVENLVLTGTAGLTGTGNALDNFITGNSGNNLLNGGAGDDLLIGGGGADTLIGSTGADVLTGGAGNDVFQFRTGSESAAAAHDTILDFVRGQDIIDLRQVDANSRLTGNQDFSFIGADEFGGAGAASAGQLRYQISGADLMLQMDINGDGVADMQILLSGNSHVSSGDFLL